MPVVRAGTAQLGVDPGRAAKRATRINLVIFCPLVLAVVLLGKQNETTAMAAMIFFYARLAHWLVYTANLPALRTLAFFAGFFVQLTLAYQVVFA